MPTMPLNPNCPFEREEGDGCYNGTLDEAGNFTGEWRCIYHDPEMGCACQ